MIQSAKPLLIAGLAGTLAALAAVSAFAFPEANVDAKIDAALKPHFGDLLFPPIRHYERFRFEGRREGYRPFHPERFSGYGRGGAQDITVDCGDERAGPQPLSDALYYLAPGGTLHIRQGSTCHDSLFIDKPVVIVGEADSAFSTDGLRRPVIEAIAGGPCIAASPGMRVELRDIALVDEQAARNGCVEGEDADIALTRVSVRYAGQRSAVDVTGGRLIVRDSQIDARQADSAVLADDTAVQIEHSEIRSQLAGLDLTPALTGPSEIVNTRLIGPSNGEAIEPRTVGIMVRGGQRASGQLDIRGSFIGHWRTGLWLDAGSRVDLVASRIYKSALGVLVDEAEGTVRDSAIGASEVGIYAGSGKLVVDHNRIHGFRQFPIVLDQAVVASEREDLVYPDGGSCRTLRDWAPRCVPLEYLPYDLTVEDAAPDWGVHGAVGFDGYGPPPGPRGDLGDGRGRDGPAGRDGHADGRNDGRNDGRADGRPGAHADPRAESDSAERRFNQTAAAAAGATMGPPAH